MIPFPNKKYQIIYADPPWPYDKGLWERQNSRASSHYKLMTIEEICDLPINDIADTNCHLYLWIPNQQLGNGWGKKVYESWGFVLKNIITWCKPQISLGYYFRNNTEHLLFGVKGSIRTLDRRQGTHIIAERERHSKKPNIFRDKIIEWSGDLPRIELFARPPKDRLFEDESYKGWDVWGNEV